MPVAVGVAAVAGRVVPAMLDPKKPAPKQSSAAVMRGAVMKLSAAVLGACWFRVPGFSADPAAREGADRYQDAWRCKD